jgi:hypothetical protein
MRARLANLVLVCAAALAAGCITPASGKKMAVPGADLGPGSPAIAKAVEVGQVTGGKDSFVSIKDAELRDALIETLRTGGFLAEGQGAPLVLDVQIVKVGDGSGASTFNSEVQTDFRYTIKETRSGGLVIDEVISATFAATPSDALIGATRHVMAVEGSARKNLAALVKRLNTIQRKGAPSAAATQPPPAKSPAAGP